MGSLGKNTIVDVCAILDLIHLQLTNIETHALHILLRQGAIPINVELLQVINHPIGKISDEPTQLHLVGAIDEVRRLLAALGPLLS